MRVPLLVPLCLLVAALPASGGPGSWTAFEHGEAARAPADPGHTNGNAAMVCVRTGPFVAFVEAFAITDTLSADQSGAGSGGATNWYSLGFTGSADATDHRWRITTLIHGLGDGQADGLLDGAAWGEAVLAIEFSGDNQNAACGQLAVDDSGGASVSLSGPAGFRVTLQKNTRTRETDVYEVSSPKTTTGPGKVCRVRVSTSAEVRLAAQSFLGIASAHVIGVLHAELTMTGSCRIGDQRVEDRFTVEMKTGEMLESAFSGPSDGVEPGRLRPTDLPSEEERDGRLPSAMDPDLPEDAAGPTVPAEDDDAPAPASPEVE